MSAALKSNQQAPLLLPSEAGLNLPGQGQDWLDKFRQSAEQQFINQGLPVIQDEEWRYTDIRRLKKQQFSVQFKTPDVSSALSNLPNYDVTRLVIINGLFAPTASADAIPNGIEVTSLAMALADDSLKGLLGSTLSNQQHAFTLLNSAYCLDGVVIRIADKCVLDKPIEIVHVSTANTDDNQPSVSHSRNIILAGKLCQAQIIERFISLDDSNPYLTNAVTEITAHDGAQLEHYKVQQESTAAFHVGGVFVNQGRDSKVVNHNVVIGGSLVRNDIQFKLLGKGAHGGMNGLVLGKDAQHVHNHTEVEHRVAHCSSDEFYKNVLDDKSRAIFRGRIVVSQDAQKTDAEQQNDNLLLSANAEANTKPQLEIYADDVVCSHGATIGQLEEKSLFYFQSRGINKADARRLLTYAFANEVIERVKFTPLKEELNQHFLGQLLPENYQQVFA